MYNRLLRYLLGLILAGLVTAPFALAQMGAGPPKGGSAFQPRFQEIKRTQICKYLGVNEQTVDRLLEVEQRYQPRRKQLTAEMRTEYDRLMQIMSKPSPSEADVKAILANMKRKKQEMQDLQTRQGDEEEALLSPVQQALYLMYQRKLLQEARSVKGRGPGETGPFTPSAPREIPVSRPAGPPR
jgi:Spy/CpxP family protein refolding chaperone